MAEKEELENTPDEKKDKKEKKKREKEEKKKKKGENEEETEEEKLSSKVALVFVTFLIIIIWLGIIAILIKADVGGFGSTVLAPLLKDVPYVNRILPETSDGEDLIEDTEHQFDSLDEAIARIKELELALDDAGSKAAADAQTIADLQEQVTDLAKYRDEQAEFEKLQEKFYEDVVFSDSAPDINEYKTYYESIDPANAEVLYKQVVAQLTYSQEVEDYAQTYSSMKPAEAAAIFNTMTDDLDLVAAILLNMDTQSRADILGKMDVETAARLTAIMQPSE